MKYILSLSLLFSFNILAEESPTYEPNVAEYYVSTFKAVSYTHLRAHET